MEKLLPIVIVFLPIVIFHKEGLLFNLMAL